MLELLDVKQILDYTFCAVQPNNTIYNAVGSATALHINTSAKSPSVIGIID